MKPEDWRAYQRQNPEPAAAAGYPSPRVEKATRGSLSWAKVFLCLGLAAIGGCAYSLGRLAEAVPSAVRGASSPSVGVLTLDEEIYGSLWVTEALNRFSQDDNIKGVVLRVNSPGGAVAPCQEIYKAIKALPKPVVISMGSVAASGGLYVAAAGDVIMANPGTLTGSIGVIMQNLEVGEAMDKVGLKSQTIKSGAFKDLGSPFRAMRAEERDLLQALVSEVYEQFLRDLAAGRPKLKPEELRRLADGRIFSGAEAQKLGLVDELGGFEEAIRRAAALGGLVSEGRPELLILDGRPGWWDSLMRGRLNLDPALNLPPALRPGFSLKYIYQPDLGSGR